jgi:SAM-dependent methyltransferase
MPDRASSAYGDDLAYIHDGGFGHVAHDAARELLARLARGVPGQDRVRDGLVVDLGCGSGILAAELTAAGYQVLGFDQSEAMLTLARRRAPRGEFRCESFVTAAIPRCRAVTAVGEVLNYLFDRANRADRLRGLFARVFEALEPGGLFLLDVAGPGRAAGAETRRRNFTVGPDWACLFSADEDARRRILTRRITTFRRIGQTYRRCDEVHRLRLYPRAEIVARLRSVGFQVSWLRGYADFRFPRGSSGFAARKPW